MTTKKSKPARLLSYRVYEDDGDGTLVLMIGEEKGVRSPREVRSFYRVEVNPHRKGAYRLHKLVHHDEEPACYDVVVGKRGSCDCPGYESHGHCKHQQILSEAVEDGKVK